MPAVGTFVFDFRTDPFSQLVRDRLADADVVHAALCQLFALMIQKIRDTMEQAVAIYGTNTYKQIIERDTREADLLFGE